MSAHQQTFSAKSGIAIRRAELRDAAAIAEI